MGYIRSNEEYYESLGHSSERAKELSKMDECSVVMDYGYCNPIKAKLAVEEEEKILKNIS
jgi:hypothetical protein